MRNTPMLLRILAAIVLAIVAWRVATGGVPGMKTYAVAALGVALFVASFLAARGTTTTTTTTSSTTVPPR